MVMILLFYIISISMFNVNLLTHAWTQVWQHYELLASTISSLEIGTSLPVYAETEAQRQGLLDIGEESLCDDIMCRRSMCTRMQRLRVLPFIDKSASDESSEEDLS